MAISISRSAINYDRIKAHNKTLRVEEKSPPLMRTDDSTQSLEPLKELSVSMSRVGDN